MIFRRRLSPAHECPLCPRRPQATKSTRSTPSRRPDEKPAPTKQTLRPNCRPRARNREMRISRPFGAHHSPLLMRRKSSCGAQENLLRRHLKKRAMGLLAKNGGSLDHTTLLHKLSIDAVAFKKLVVTLEMCTLIESEMSERGKIIYHLSAA